MGVTSEIITQKEGEILDIFNQLQDMDTSDRSDDRSISEQSQLLAVSYFV